MRNWLGQVLFRQAELDARQESIHSLTSHRHLRDRSDRRALESCCAVLSCSFDATQPLRPQARRLLAHYHAWCEALGVPSKARSEQTAIEVMALWTDRCKAASA